MVRKTPTIKDVAARAGVSIATVSRVLNQQGGSRPLVEKAVRSAARELGFRPNAIGRRLKTARTRTIGVLVPSLQNPIFAETVQGLQWTAEAAGYSLLLTASSYDPLKEARAIELLLANRVEGLVLTVADEAASPMVDLLERERVPFVLVFNPPLRPGVSTVTVDNEAAARELVEHLIGLGHRRIAMIVGTFRASDRSALRRAGFEGALRRHGLKPGAVVEVGFDSLDLTGPCRSLLSGRWPPSALFCSTDMLAMAAIRALKKLGLSVPGDVSVAGFDGISVGEWMTPQLTTAVQPAEDMGAEAFARLLGQIERDEAPRHVTLEHRLRLGESSAPIRGRAIGPRAQEPRQAVATHKPQ